MDTRFRILRNNGSCLRSAVSSSLWSVGLDSMLSGHQVKKAESTYLEMARVGIEPKTFALLARRSNQLS